MDDKTGDNIKIMCLFKVITNIFMMTLFNKAFHIYINMKCYIFDIFLE